MFQFGSGVLFGIPTVGSLPTNPTPQTFGTMQDVNFEVSQKLERLMGANKFPDDVAPGDMTITGKTSFANINIDIYNNLFFADQASTGTTAQSYLEPHSVPASAPLTVTVTNSTTFSKDEGVSYAATGQRFTRTTASPSQGQYNVSAGVYTFSAADEGAAVLINYAYTTTAGRTLTVNNQLQGYGPVFELYCYEPYQGQNGWHLYACRASKLSAPQKRSGYVVVEMDFEAFASPAGKVIDFFQTSI